MKTLSFKRFKVRNKIMFEALMQKTRIDVEMFPNGDSTERDKKFVANYQGVLTREVEFRDRKLGCIGINRRNCDPRISLYIKGDTVEYSLNSTKGLFKLSPQNELVGYIIADQ